MVRSSEGAVAQQFKTSRGRCNVPRLGAVRLTNVRVTLEYLSGAGVRAGEGAGAGAGVGAGLGAGAGAGEGARVRERALTC
jgi:hypothetical protein